MDVSRNEDNMHKMVGEAFDHGQNGIYDINPDVYADPPPGWAIPHHLRENAEKGRGYMDTPDAAATLYPEQPHQFWTGKRIR